VCIKFNPVAIRPISLVTEGSRGEGTEIPTQLRIVDVRRGPNRSKYSNVLPFINETSISRDQGAFFPNQDSKLARKGLNQADFLAKGHLETINLNLLKAD